MVARTPLGNLVRTLRKERKLTQAELAVELGVSRSHIAGIESGGDMPGREKLVAIAAFFDVPLSWLASPSGEFEPGAAAARTQEEALLLYAWRLIPQDETAALLKMILARVGSPPKGG